MGLFHRHKKKIGGKADGRSVNATFSRDAFTDAYKPIIAPRMPADLYSTDTQKRLLANLRQVFPTVNTTLGKQELPAMEYGALEKRIGVGMIACKLDNMLGMTLSEDTVSQWGSITTEQLIDVYILLNHYMTILTPDASIHICHACEYVCAELQKRMPEGTAADNTAYAAASGISGKYADGIDYVLQCRPQDDLYFVEIHDHTSRYLTADDAEPGMMGYAAFMLTETEYNRKAVQNDSDGMNELVGKLLAYLPMDRLMATGAIHPITHERRDFLDLPLQNETMDDGAYPKYKRQRAVPYLRAFDRVYVLFMRATGDQIPFLDEQGDAWLFSKKEYADGAVQAHVGFDLFCKAFDQNELQAFVRSWYRFGIARWKLNPGTYDHCANAARDDLLPDADRPSESVDASLQHLIVRFRQNSVIRNNPVAQETAETMWHSIRRELHRFEFFVPLFCERDPDETKNHSARDLTMQTASGQDGKRQMPDGAITRPRTVTIDESLFLCGFTNPAALHAFFGENERVSVLPYEALIARLPDDISGIIVNPGVNALILSRESSADAAEKNEPDITPDDA